MIILLLHKRSILFFFGGILFIGISFGVYQLAAHPEMQNWVQKKLVITHIKTDKKVAALTFDDGPDPDTTPLVLDALKKHDAKATFFVMGKRAEEHPDILQRIAAEGHEIGNHSYSHAHYKKYNDKKFLLDEIRRTNRIIYSITAQHPQYFRPPGGYLSYDLIDISKEEGLTIAYWTSIQDSKDWVEGKSAERIAAYVIKHIRPGQIILLHDGCSNGHQTARAVDLILEELKQEGYSFVSFSELMNLEKSE
ncbi:MAG TPA: polysaccharide deacetylase family protein [Syntrophomonadaceae bacterium]|jgi:peptidoglycan/xylan/chitin deacetylase (PgdA/CDA1 family)|nr:polysaccharide deacetylase family protein [Syntrophomonadaceae bacterium]